MFLCGSQILNETDLMNNFNSPRRNQEYHFRIGIWGIQYIAAEKNLRCSN